MSEQDQPQIVDIQQDHHKLDLKAEIRNGLKAKKLSLPSLLLWDDQGQKLFDGFSQTPTYYPFHDEIEVLGQHGADIGGSIPADGVLLELGCGAIHKTKLILAGFHREQKHAHYYALDVAREGLQDSLRELGQIFNTSPYVKITGLLGNYDDGVSWLSSLKRPRDRNSVTIMWLGNSIANLRSQNEASSFLMRFRKACHQAQLSCRFLVSIDVCQHDAKVLEAYNVDRHEYRDFLLNALDAANRALGYKAFCTEDWTAGSWFESGDRNLHFYVMARSDVTIELVPSVNDDRIGLWEDGHNGNGLTNGSHKLTIRSGEHIQLVTSGKWSEESTEQVARRAGFGIRNCWKANSGDYCIFSFVNIGENALSV